jgi:hypothetical protein
MSNAGVFTLITQDDTTDSFFTAYNYLETRLKNIYNKTNTKPSIDDIEKSHIVFVKSRYYPYVSIASEYTKIGGNTYTLGYTNPELSFTLPSYGDFTNDIVLHIRINALGDKDAYLNNIEPTEEKPLYRYCAYPGIRLLENVELRSGGGVLIDSYQPEDVLAYKNFFVGSNYKSGWDRCYGQNEIQQATYNSRSFTGILNYSNGYQMPKLYHEAFNMFIPIHLWFCEDVSNALINYSMSASQRVIKIKMASLDKIIQALIYDNTGTGDIRIAPSGTSIVPLPINNISFQATLYINQLYTYSYISDIMRNDFTFNLIRVHKRQITGLQNPSDLILLNQLQFPGEYLCVGFRNKANVDDFDRWHLMGSNYLTEDTNHIRGLHVPAIIWNSDHGIRQLVTREAIQSTSLNNIVADIELTTSAGISIYPQLSESFFNNYLPIRYHKNSSVVSPYDNNMFLITFCFYPGKFNPSGYFNLSTTRELHIKYWLHPDYSDTYNNSYEIVICMSALNFLYRQGDNLNLKYTM